MVRPAVCPVQDNRYPTSRLDLFTAVHVQCMDGLLIIHDRGIAKQPLQVEVVAVLSLEDRSSNGEFLRKRKKQVVHFFFFEAMYKEKTVFHLFG